LQLLLKRLDQYTSSSIECERERAVRTVLALLRHYLALCTPGSCSLGCSGSCMHLRSTSDTGQSSTAGNCCMLTRSHRNHTGRSGFIYLSKQWNTLCSILTTLSLFAKWRRNAHDFNLERTTYFWAVGPALLPPRECLRLGERIIAYLPRCGDVSPDIRTVAAQVIYFLPIFSFISC
jgi:hypothetical protein